MQRAPDPTIHRVYTRRFDMLEEALLRAQAQHETLQMFGWARRLGELEGVTLARHPCGTVACAMGTLALFPPAQEEGLSLRSDPAYGGRRRADVVPVTTFEQLRELAPGTRCDVWYGKASGMYAACHFLGVSMAEAMRMFSPDHYDHVGGEVPVDAVLARVRQVRAERGYVAQRRSPADERHPGY